MNRQQPQWMIVVTTPNLPEAHIIAGRLGHHAIPALVSYTPGAGALGITIGRLGAVHVLVHPNHYERALAIIDPDFEPDSALPHGDDADLYLDLDE